MQIWIATGWTLWAALVTCGGMMIAASVGQGIGRARRASRHLTIMGHVRSAYRHWWWAVALGVMLLPSVLIDVWIRAVEAWIAAGQ